MFHIDNTEIAQCGRILVLGLGNPAFGDAGVGWSVALACAARKPTCAGRLSVEVDCSSLSGMSLVERLIGYECAILIDAIRDTDRPAGWVCSYMLEELQHVKPGRTSSATDPGLHSALQLATRLGAYVPRVVTLVAVYVPEMGVRSDTLSPAVSAAVPRAVDTVMEILEIIDEKARTKGYSPAQIHG